MRTLKTLKPIYTSLVSFELFFTLFLFAGSYKADPRFAWFPIDPTLFFFGLSIASGMIIFIVKEKMKINLKDFKFLLLFGAFAAYVVASLVWTPSIAYAREKAFFVCSILAWTTFATTLIISRSPERLKRFLLFCVLFGFWKSIEGLTETGQKGGFIQTAGSNYIEFSRILGLAAIVITYTLLFVKMKKQTRIFLVLLLASLIFNILNAGARGPLLSFVFSLLPIVYYGWIVREKTLKLHVSVLYTSAAALLGLLYIGFLFITNKLPTALLRLLVIFQEDGMGASAGTRLQYYKDSLSYWKANLLFGNGIGSWPILHDGADVKNYPHNIILEIGSELGLIGIVLFFLLFLYLFKSLHGSNKDFSYYSLLLTSTIMFYFINSLMSGDINENRYYFAFLGLGTYAMKHLNSKFTVKKQIVMREF